MNNNTAIPHDSSRLRARLRGIGVIVLLLGLTAAGVVYWMGTHGPEGPEGIDGTDERLLAGPSRAERHQVGLLYGKFGLRILDMMNGLKRHGTQAVIVAAALILIAGLIAGGCVYIAHVMDRDDDT